MSSAWFSHPCRPFTNPAENGWGQSGESQRLRKETNSPTLPVISCPNARRGKKRRTERCQDHSKYRILREGLEAIQPGYTVEEIPETQCAGEDLNRVGWNEPGNRPEWHAYTYVVHSKRCESCGNQNWPDSPRHQQQD